MRNTTVMLVCLLLGLGQLSMGLVFPSLPWIAKDFGISLEQVQLLVSAYLLGFGPSQFVCGPLSDTLGRKSVLLTGLLISMLGLGIIIVYHYSFVGALVGRFFQGAGMGCCLVLATVTIRDHFRNTELPLILSQIAVIVSIVPIIAPVLGGVINHHFGWLVIFMVLLLYVILVGVIAVFSFQETITGSKKGIRKPKRVFKQYLDLLSSPNFMRFACLGWLNFSLLITAVSVTSFMMQTQIGMTSNEYAKWALIPSCGLLVGAYISRRLHPILGSKRVLMVGSACHTCAALWLFYSPKEPLLLMVGVFLIVLGNGVSQPCLQALVMAPYKKQAGVAAAMSGGGEMLVASAISLLLIQSGVSQPWHLSWVIIGVVVAFVGVSRWEGET